MLKSLAPKHSRLSSVRPTEQPPATLLAEWAPQSGVLLTWPRPDGDFRSTYAAVEHTFAAIAAAISLRELVGVVCMDNHQVEKVRRLVKSLGGNPNQLRTWIALSNDVWTRDHGPLAVRTPAGPKLLNFIFNGWGGKYPACDDNAITGRLDELGAFNTYSLKPVDFVLEGGSIDTDGEGSLLTTASCLLSPTRNPGLTREDIQARLKKWLGIERIHWLEHGALEGDDTDGHIDTLARFCDPWTIAYQNCDDHGDSHYKTINNMAEQLCTLRRMDTTPYRLVPLPWPQPIFNREHHRLPATYANFLIINSAVLVPTYNDPADTEALHTLAACFPTRKIIGLDCRSLIQQFGSLHCASMQLPAGVLS